MTTREMRWQWHYGVLACWIRPRLWPLWNLWFNFRIWRRKYTVYADYCDEAYRARWGVYP